MTLIGDERLRLVAALALVLAISQLANPVVAVFGLVAALMLALAARLGRREWRRVLHTELFVVLIVLTLPFAVAGTPVLAIGPLEASAEGLVRAGLVAIKITAAVLIIMALLGTLAPERIGAGLHGLKVPEPLVRLFLLMVRYLALMRGEAARLHDAMRARAFAPRSNRHTWRSYGNLIGMLLVRALERAERVEEAMRCRGYSGRFPHAALPLPAARDWIGLSLVLLVAGALVVGGAL